MKPCLRISLFLSLGALPNLASAALPQENIFAADACSKQEAWFADASLEQPVVSPIKDNKENVPLVFAAAHALSSAKNPSAADRIRSEFWKSRVLFGAGIFHLATEGFNRVLILPGDSSTLGLQVAALSCLNEIQRQHNRLHLSDDAALRLPSVMTLLKQATKPNAELGLSVADAAAIYLLRDFAAIKNESRLENVLAEYPTHIALLRGMRAFAQSNNAEAVPALNNFLSAEKPSAFTRRFQSRAYFALGRSYLGLQQWQAAEKPLQSVSKESNDVVRALVELSWIQLMNDQYEASAASAMGLIRGDLQAAFAPEAYVVIAMVLNELCQYPAALAAIRALRREYREDFIWLREQNNKKKDPLYGWALDTVDGKTQGLPVHVRNEWIRSPIFLSFQGEMNLLLSERRLMGLFARDYKISAKAALAKFKEAAKEYKEELADAKRSADGKLIVTDSLRARNREARDARATYAMLQTAATEWNRLVQAFDRLRPPLEKKLIQAMNVDLQKRNQRMLAKLRELAGKIFLIEIEIFNGASQDVVWKNSHPGYTDFVKKVNQEKKAAERSKVWDWGQLPLFASGKSETWSDELGTMRALVYNNCENKNQYSEVILNAEWANPSPSPDKPTKSNEANDDSEPKKP